MEVYLVFSEYIYGEGKASDCIDAVFMNKSLALTYVSTLPKSNCQRINIVSLQVNHGIELVNKKKTEILSSEAYR